jgi:hypothetical protein
MTCPQVIIIGGFWSVAWSLDTGHAKTEWYRFSGGSGTSIYAARWKVRGVIGKNSCMYIPAIHLLGSTRSYVYA